MFFTVTGFALMLIHGVGIHLNDLPDFDAGELETLTKLALVTNFFYFWNLVWSKLSVLLLYVRIFRFQNYFTTVAMCVGGFVVAWAVTIVFLTFFNCVPLAKHWDSTIPGHCFSKFIPRALNALSTIITDLVILLLPVPQIWKLQLATSKKIACTFSFGLGSL